MKECLSQGSKGKKTFDLCFPLVILDRSNIPHIAACMVVLNPLYMLFRQHQLTPFTFWDDTFCRHHCDVAARMADKSAG